MKKTINKLDDNTIEITTEVRTIRIKEELEEEKKMRESDKKHTEEEIVKIDELLSHFK
tara:strand:+ start:464 stop:637 length:174 start_codon:yes stop_codon:yes gene_type:complete